MTSVHAKVYTPRREHSVPFLWPMAVAIELGAAGLQLYQDNIRFLAEAEQISLPPEPSWATDNRVLLDLDTLRLRDFSRNAAGRRVAVPALVDPPYAGHSSTIVDHAKGQSLVETLVASGLDRVLVTDWKAASPEMRDFDIDKYVAEINVVVDDLGGQVHLVGLCQGGWMSAMYAARFPAKVRSLVLAGAPIDTDAGSGPIREMAHRLPMSFYENLVAAGGGRMLGEFMLAGWKSMHPERQLVDKYLDLYAHIEDSGYVKRTERFERWYENPVPLPGRYYLQAIKELFKENQLATGKFVALGHRLSLRDINVPLYLLAGKDDDITTKEQVFRAESLVGTPPARIRKQLVPGGHIGLFMGRHVLADNWPEIGRWIKEVEAPGK